MTALLDLNDHGGGWRRAWVIDQDTSEIAQGGHIQIIRMGWNTPVRVEPAILGLDRSALAGLYWRPMPKPES